MSPRFEQIPGKCRQLNDPLSWKALNESLDHFSGTGLETRKATVLQYTKAAY